ncbi:3-hydroxyacyl-CoA dehydrogenase/enoyl-CoA hydratase family protein [Halobacillus sp. Marseille-P3879]|uniref:3-hydroxyacyl-CoA dehydrogenase/enoyl-CoA hydratase family protein n=1 Tax=Halobacillus sp. Marseille-P3879 TaxID=2045014 RepID=UPI000C7E182C|nr:3-hydroxyacyl-CoA dehydrogenase/enoyl-CoA hydratase family protein [Halobacillus sp. Marseille-P3879]
MGKKFKLGVVGAGNMGAGIAQKMAQEGLHVTLVDLKEEQVNRGVTNIRSTLEEGVTRGIFNENQVTEVMDRIHGSTTYDDLKDADLVVEAVFEDKGIKSSVFQKLDAICAEKTILATNTSSLFVKDIAECTNRPNKVIGMHYFYHPAKNRLVEVIPHEGTSKETIETTLLIGKLHNKTCISVKDSPGFAVNRYFVPFLNESVHLLKEGFGNIPTIDAAAKQAFEIGMGPFELMNVTGLPIAEHSSSHLANEISEFYAPADLLKEQVETQKEWDLNGEVMEDKVDDIKKHLLAVVFGIASAQVEEGVASIEDTDIGAKVGLKWKLGPFELMNKIGIKESYSIVDELYSKRPSFQNPSMLKAQAENNKPFVFKYVDTEVKNSIAYLTINRPEAMNALNPVVVEQLEEAFESAEENPDVNGIAIQGAGKAFVAGADIKFFIDCIENDHIEKNVAFTRRGHHLFRRIETSNKKTVAILDGLSLGGGSELALACQAIVATNQGTMAFPESGLGIYPGLGGMLRLNHHIGKELTKYYVMTGKAIRAEEAKELNLVTELTNLENIQETVEAIVKKGRTDKYEERNIPNKLNKYKQAFADHNVEMLLKGENPEPINNETADKLINTLSGKGPIALKTINHLVNKQAELTIDDGIDLELNHLKEIFSTEDALRGLTASISNTPPVFIGEKDNYEHV